MLAFRHILVSFNIDGKQTYFKMCFWLFSKALVKICCCYSSELNEKDDLFRVFWELEDLWLGSNTVSVCFVLGVPPSFFPPWQEADRARPQEMGLQ